MDQSREERLDADSRVCGECIVDSVLAAEIEADGEQAECDRCGETRMVMSIDDISDSVKPVYETYVVPAEDRMRIYADSDNAHWEQGGDTPNDIIQELVGCEPEVADALVGALSHGNWRHVRDGSDDYYDATGAGYELAPRETAAYRDAMERLRYDWDQFVWDLQHQNRFFNEDPTAYVERMFGPVLRGDLTNGAPPIVDAGPGTDMLHVYRGREASSEADRRRIYENPAAELGPPPQRLRRAGRMNATGIAAFYGCSDETTCVAELRVPVGGTAVVGTFRFIQGVRLLDLRALARSSWVTQPSFFASDYIQQRAYVDFMSGIHDLLRRPVLPGDEAFEYLPTQFIAEYLENHVDGVLMASSLVSRGENDPPNHGLNVVLFSGSSSVVNGRGGSPYAVGVIHGADYDDEWYAASEYVDRTVRAEPLPGVGISDHEPDAIEPTLEINEDDVRVVRVRGISYDAPSRGVAFSDRNRTDRLEGL